ncbi:jerky protein homolog-like [Lucilia sericata]|uniref:jerky protein homolog-like n=1 Tax=Lucilia sericata TaxID=13632 RepID=UPI0018A7F017|nr:jerky protein homolog-like [Lucilia sericata]
MSTRKRLCLKDKLKIVDDHRNGLRVTDLYKKYGIKKSTICTILKSKENLLKNAETTNFWSKNRKAIKQGEFPIMENRLFSWFQRQRRCHNPITGAILQFKAKEIHKKLYGGDFNASHGWLTRFKNRYGIRLLKQSGEKLSSDAQEVEPFKRKLNQIILENNLPKDAIFNADETGLFWKVLPDKTYVHSGERSAPGRKISKERITVLVCSNASGSKKIKPLLIGKSRSPRAFRNKTLPVDYTHSKNAWITCTLFKTWFFNNFVPQVEEFLAQNNLPLNAILLLDNAPSHPPAEELVKQTHSGKIWAHYMPPNVTPLIQPMDQNAIRLLKLHYKNSLLSRLFSTPEQNVSLFLKQFNLFEATIILASAWKSVSESSLAKCWNKILRENYHFDEEDDLPFASYLRHDEDTIAVETGVQLLRSIFPTADISVDDLNSWVENITPPEDVDEDEIQNDEDIVEAENLDPKINHADAVKHFEACIKWTEQNNIDYSKSMVLRELQEEAIKKQISIPKKQTLLNRFFK